MTHSTQWPGERGSVSPKDGRSTAGVFWRFEKKLPKSWRLRKLAFAEIGAPPGRGCYWDAQELRQESTNTVLAFPEWEWADFVDGRLVVAVEGRLCAARLGRGKLVGEKLLHDFNKMKFEAIAAPY